MATTITPAYHDVTGVLDAIDSALDDWTVSGDAMRMAPPRTDAVAIFGWELRDGCNTECVYASFNGVSLESVGQLQPGTRIWVDGIPRRIVSRSDGEEIVSFVLEEIWPSVWVAMAHEQVV